MFEYETTDITTRIEDRPNRPVPQRQLMTNQFPWLASNFNPADENVRPTVKSIVSRTVNAAIPIAGAAMVLGFFFYITVNLFSFYSN